MTTLVGVAVGFLFGLAFSRLKPKRRTSGVLYVYPKGYGEDSGLFLTLTDTLEEVINLKQVTFDVRDDRHGAQITSPIVERISSQNSKGVDKK